MGIRTTTNQIGHLLKETYKGFMADNALKLSAALSYYTIFALPPLIIVIISMSGMFFSADAVKGAIYGQIRGLAGNAAALQIQQITKNVNVLSSNTLAATLGMIILVIGATGIFSEIQGSIDIIWGIKTQHKRGMLKFIYSHLMTFAMVVSVGFLIAVGLVGSSLVGHLNEHLVIIFPQGALAVFHILNLLVGFIVITLAFNIVFKILPAGKLAFRDCIAGASCTAFLFLLGKFTIGIYLGTQNITSVYGAAGSIIVILCWIYYSAAILYFGAEFTKVYAHARGKDIAPKAFSAPAEKQDTTETGSAG